MNHNGFTLIEILLTLGIIAILSTVIVINTINLNEKNKANQYEKFKEKITTAGCSYIDSDTAKALRESCKQEKYCTISLATLISLGLIDENLIDPSNNKNVKDEQNNINISNTNYINKYEFENIDGYAYFALQGNYESDLDEANLTKTYTSTNYIVGSYTQDETINDYIKILSNNKYTCDLNNE